MYDTAIAPRHQLSHDRPCAHCGHPPHTYLACSDDCGCTPTAPGPSSTGAVHRSRTSR